MPLITQQVKSIYSIYRAGEVSVHQACCERATQPYSLGGGGTICPGSRPAGVTTRSPRIVTECLFTRSICIKMYVHVHDIYSLFRFFSLSVCMNMLYQYVLTATFDDSFRSFNIVLV